MQFQYLAQRSVNYFLDTYAKFMPLEGTKVSVESQNRAYDFLKGIYQNAFEAPEVLSTKQMLDDSYGRWELNKAKPGLDVNIRKTIAKMEAIVAAFFSACLLGIWEDGALLVPCSEIAEPAALKKLSKLGAEVTKKGEVFLIAIEEDTFDGLKFLSTISDEYYKMAEYKCSPYVLFSRGVFDVKSGFNVEVFCRCSNDESALKLLLDFLEGNGYRRIENREYANKISKITLDYVKFFDSNDTKLSSSWNVRTHSGIEIAYDELKQDNFYLGLRIPYFKELLRAEEEMPLATREFVLAHTKKCDGCRYCVQTDKTGTRPFVAVPIEGQMLCPLFPGFSYKFFEVDEKLVNQITGFLRFIEDKVGKDTARCMK